MKRNRRIMGMYIIGARGGKPCLLGHSLAWQDFLLATNHIVQDPHGETFHTRMMKLGIGEGRSAQGMSDPPSQLIGQEHQDVMG